MDMRVDQAGHHHPAFAINPEIHRRARITAFEHLGDDAGLVEDQPGEALERAFFVDGEAIDIVDQRVREAGCR